MRARARFFGVLAAFSAAMVALAAASTVASAKTIHPLLGSFGSFGAQVLALGVDQATGDVYVYSGTKLYKFDASGNPVEFTSTKTNTIGVEFPEWDRAQIAIDESSGPAHGDIYLTGNYLSVVIYNPAGEEIGRLPYSEIEGGPPCGVAVDHAGNVYVGTVGGYIDKFAPSANPVTAPDYVASIDAGGEPCNLAVDSVGNVYASAYFSGGVTRYDALQFGLPSAAGALVDTRGYSLAVDAATDEVYVNEANGISQFGPHGEPFGEPLFTFAHGGEGAINFSVGVAVNESTGDVYIGGGQARQGPIEVFGPAEAFPDLATGGASGVQATEATLNGTVNPSGVEAEECLFEYGESTSYTDSVPCAETPAEIGSGSEPVEVHAQSTGLAIGTTYHFRLVVKAKGLTQRGEDKTFVTPQTPLVQNTHVISVRGTSATVGAEIDPRYGHTTYRFEYGTTTAYQASVPVPYASAGSGGQYMAVTAGLTGLQSGTTYHFRVVASNSVGLVEGPDATFTTEGTRSESPESCPNAGVRALQGSSYLPNCRAYEMVSPNDKNGGNVAARTSMTQAAVDGNAVKYSSTALFGDATGSEIAGGEYIAERGAQGWNTHSINPLQNSVPYVGSSHQKYEYFTPNLEEGVYHALTPVLEGFPNVGKNINLYLRTDPLTAGTGSYQLLSNSAEPLLARPVEGHFEETTFAGASRDMSHIIFESLNDLTTTAKGLNARLPKLYEWHAGEVTLVGILPGGAPASESTAGAGAGVEEVNHEESWTESAISADGSRIVFTAPPAVEEEGVVMGNLYMRIDGQQTVQINESERTDCNVERKEAEPAYECTGAPELDPNGAQPARFWYASEDGARVFFTTHEALTDDASGVGGNGTANNLYMYDLEAPAGHRLTLISTDATDSAYGGGNSCGCGNDRAIIVAGISKDGRYVYFTSDAPLQAGDPVPPGLENGSGGQLYVWHEGTLKFVAPLAGEHCAFESECWGLDGRSYGDTFRITPDGTSVAFASSAPELAERAGAITNGLYRQVYVYNYPTNSLACASCNRVGLPLSSQAGVGAGPVDQMHWFALSGATAMYQDRPLSDDGRYVFFDTAEALVPQDTNGRRDVYEYDTATGEVHLITSGTCACDAGFVDASADGSNVFFVTSEKLVAADQGSSADLYDARIDGGFVAQSAAPVPPCAGEECQPPGAPSPQLGTPSSVGFVGAGSQPQVVESAAGKATPRLTDKQRLQQALKVCAKRPKHRRAACRARARRRYGTTSAKAGKAESSKRRRGGRS